MKLYKYVGSGAGVPGLPHEVTDAQAKELGVEDILKAAVENGSYVEANERPGLDTREKSVRATRPADKQSEVNNG